MTISNNKMMTLKTQLLFCVCLFSSISIQAQSISQFIHVDQFGYLMEAEKVAVISNPKLGYNGMENYTAGSVIEVRNFLNDEVVFSGSPELWNNGEIHSQSGDAGWWFDFSDVNTSGSYYIFDPSTNERSGRFEININPYHQVLEAGMKAFYYNRCNDEKIEPFAEAKWTDQNNFSQDVTARDAYDRNNPETEKDMSGGWFDAGDYNKYVTFAHDPIHQLLTSYSENPSIYTDDWNIPESGDGIPDILNEIIWELEWMKKMINEDGSVHIKIGSVSFNDNNSAPPSANTDARFYAPTCSSASLAVASCFAHAAFVCQSIEGLEGYGAQLRQDAIRCFDYYQSFIDNNNYETECDDGTVKSGDADWNIEVQADNIIVACSYLFRLTGESKYSSLVSSFGLGTEIIVDDFIPLSGSVLLEALLLYTTIDGSDPDFTNEIITSVTTAQSNDWGNYFHFDGNNFYRAGAADWAFYWGSNRAVANIGNMCNTLVKYNISPNDNDELLRKANELVHYFHGVNPQGITYLSNMYDYGGDRCANQIYHSWFNDGTDWDDALSSLYGPAPGFLSGGPNQAYSGNLSPPANQPLQKCYADYNTGFPEVSWEISEPAIYYQAAYVRLLANYVNNSIVSSIIEEQILDSTIEVYPNPTHSTININGNILGCTIEIYNLEGKMILSEKSTSTESNINIGFLQDGMLILTVRSKDGELIHREKLYKQ